MTATTMTPKTLATYITNVLLETIRRTTWGEHHAAALKDLLKYKEGIKLTLTGLLQQQEELRQQHEQQQQQKEHKQEHILEHELLGHRVRWPLNDNYMAHGQIRALYIHHERVAHIEQTALYAAIEQTDTLAMHTMPLDNCILRI